MRVLWILLLALPLLATSTYTAKRTFNQSDGTTFSGRLQGDAFLYWIETDTGDILLFNKKTANFEYAVIKDGNLILSGNVYSPSKTRSMNRVDHEQLRNLWNAKRPK